MSKSQEGKAISRLNSMKHGLRATDSILLADLSKSNKQIFENIRSKLIEEYSPETESEKSLLDRLAVQHFRLYRLYGLENKIAKASRMTLAANLDRLSRYDSRIERQLRILHNRLNSLYSKRRNFSLTPFRDNK